MRRLQIIFVALLVGFSAVCSRGAERPQHNFLIIVDSSISMAPHKSSAVKWVREAIATRFDDQIEPGDSIDIWTYDTENNLRGFPPLIWQPQDTTNIAQQADAYLQKYPFKGRSDFSQVASDLALLVPQTQALLIVIITDGEEPFSGISLDLEINGFLSRKGKIGPAAAAKAPVLVSLSAIGGALRTWTAYFGDGRIDLATLPERTPSSTLAKSAPQKAAPKQPVKQQPVVRAPVPKKQPLIPAGETRHVFDYPAGSVFNPTDHVNAIPAIERPLELSATLRTAASSAPKPNLIANATPTNVAKVATNSSATNTVRIAESATNVPVAKIASALPKTNLITNAVVAVANPTRSNTAATMTSETKSNVVFAASVSSTGPPSAPSASPATLRQAMYAAAITGAGCILAGLILIVRKLRRPTQSIISRSLLQHR